MISIARSTLINRPIEEVFAFVNAPEKIPEWQSSAVSAELIPEGTPRVGSTLLIVRKFMGRNVDNHHEITIYEPPHRACNSQSIGPMKAEGCLLFEESEVGDTRVTITFEADPRGFIKLVAGFIGRQLSNQLENDLKTLKRLLET